MTREAQIEPPARLTLTLAVTTQRDGRPPLSTPRRVDLHGKPDAVGNPNAERAALAASRVTEARHQTRTVCLSARTGCPFIPFGHRAPGALGP